MGAVHNVSQLGFISYPDNFPTIGKLVFIINEAAVQFKKEPGIQVGAGGTPNPVVAAYEDYPLDPVNNGWGPMD